MSAWEWYLMTTLARRPLLGQVALVEQVMREEGVSAGLVRVVYGGAGGDDRTLG